MLGPFYIRDTNKDSKLNLIKFKIKFERPGRTKFQINSLIMDLLCNIELVKYNSWKRNAKTMQD